MRPRHMAGIVLLGCLALLIAPPPSARSAGTRTMYPQGTPGFRASIEWRTSTYGGSELYRRTLFKVAARRGEVILAASSAVGVGKGDILIYDPGRVVGAIGREVIPAIPSFSCAAQRKTAGNGARGRIASRAQELAGFNVGGGYLPCFYTAPATGIYNLAFLGPDGFSSDRETAVSGRIEASATDFGSGQGTSVTAWIADVAPRVTATPAEVEPGRLFTYALVGTTGDNGRPLYMTLYTATGAGYVYSITTRGIDPSNFLLYVNRTGFLDTDGVPLYRDVVARGDLPKQEQDQLVDLQGGVRILPPEHPIFFETPSSFALQSLDIPLTPSRPLAESVRFIGSNADGSTRVGVGGTFEFDVIGAKEEIYRIVIGPDLSAEPHAPGNRVLYGVAPSSGKVSIIWDGKDNKGDLLPAGQAYVARLDVQEGEIHFPLLDAENNLEGSVFTLLNPPGGVCPPYEGGCSGAFYDHRGYRTADGTLVGTAENGPLCPSNVGNPPPILASDPLLGYDSRSTQHGWGFTSGGDVDQICDPAGGFGDKKGIDTWTFYPTTRAVLPIRVVEGGSAANGPLFLPFVGASR